MIHEPKIAYEHGLPVVSWFEDRNLHSPEAGRRARIECRIMKSTDTNGQQAELLFVKIGTSRHGAFLEGRPWRLLSGFSVKPAKQLYWTEEESAVWDAVTGKLHSGIGRAATADGALVLLAGFDALPPLHLNAASASQAEVDEINYCLLTEFVIKRGALLSKHFRGKNYCPADDATVPTYDPERTAPPVNVWMEIGTWAVPAAAVLLIFGGLAWMLGLFGR